MCLGIPGKIVSKEPNRHTGVVNVGELDISINLTLTPEADIGDFVMVHAGSAIAVMDEVSVRETLQLLNQGRLVSERAAELVDLIAELAEGLGDVKLMEVCGTHTVAIARSGLKTMLPENVELVSGPGCPVCVTPTGEIDLAVELALSGDVRIVTFGDMLRVPGSRQSLEAARADGAKIDIVYSPHQAISLARSSENEHIVFLAVGFETTAPVIASTVKDAAHEGRSNLSMIVSHRLIPPALQALLPGLDGSISALICPGHVSTVIGSNAYVPLADRYGLPFVVAGFEPTDVLEAIALILRQLRGRESRVENQYARSVTPEGNLGALRQISEVFDVCSANWRGLGSIKDSALALKPEFGLYDAVSRFGLKSHQAREPGGCLCGAILSARSRPGDCPLFGGECIPEKPIGPCMVSSEGACRAAFVYG